jgi:AhpD family alkylhydroperoxidase
MKPRFDYQRAAPEVSRAMVALDQQAAKSGLEKKLLVLVRMRASQINGCAFCLDMHWKEGKAAGETEQRLYELDAWREVPDLYTERERAALAWTEALTLIADGHAPDDVFEEARACFSERELVELTLAIVSINGWNRFAIGFRMEVVPTKREAAAE